MSEESKPALVIKNLNKSFKLPHENHSGLKELAISLFKGKRNRGYETQQVLDDISFEVKQGEFFGIVGRNGSGKSTLLKLLANIYVPDSGLIEVNGSLTPFIELGVGFNPELTGRENVYLNGALLGFSRDEMDGMYDDIVSFAELGRFMDQKLKNYSSGMQVRLAFSIAIRANSDILLLDEVLAVGDQLFQKKCFEYFRELKKAKRTVILVTHDMEAVKNYCTRALLIDKSKMILIGSPSDVADEYTLRMVDQKKVENTEDRPVKNIKVSSSTGSAKVLRDKELSLTISYDTDPDLSYFIAYSLKRDGISISESSSQFENNFRLQNGPSQNVTLAIDASHLTSGEYEIDIAFYDAHTSELIAYKNAAYTQLIANDNPEYGGYFIAPSKWVS